MYDSVEWYVWEMTAYPQTCAIPLSYDMCTRIYKFNKKIVTLLHNMCTTKSSDIYEKWQHIRWYAPFLCDMKGVHVYITFKKNSSRMGRYKNILSYVPKYISGTFAHQLAVHPRRNINKKLIHANILIHETSINTHTIFSDTYENWLMRYKLLNAIRASVDSQK